MRLLRVWHPLSCCCGPCAEDQTPTECCNPIVDGDGNTLVDGNGNCIVWAPCEEGCTDQVVLLGDDVLLGDECITIGV